MHLQQVFSYLPQLPSPLARTVRAQPRGAADSQLVNLPLALLVGEDGEDVGVTRRTGVARRFRLRDASDAAQAKVLSATVSEVGLPLHGTEADGAKEAPRLVVRRWLEVELLLEEVVITSHSSSRLLHRVN